MGGTALTRPVTSPGKASNSPRIIDAARAAEAELERRGLSSGHFISSLALMQTENHTPFYLARIQPSIFLIKDRELTFHVTMDGQVSAFPNPNS